MTDEKSTGRKISPPPITVEIVEQDGTVFELRCQIGNVEIDVITELELLGHDLFLRGTHIGGPKRDVLSPVMLRASARELGRQWGARRVIIQGGVRTTGANPGHTPRRITIAVDE